MVLITPLLIHNSFPTIVNNNDSKTLGVILYAYAPRVEDCKRFNDWSCFWHNLLDLFICFAFDLNQLIDFCIINPSKL